MKRTKWIVLVVAVVASSAVCAGPDYQTGRITNVTFVGDAVFVRLDNGLPDNCAGTGYGWMLIPAANKPIQAWVIGMWLRGDLSTVTATVYTSPTVAGGYCQVTQIDPVE